MSTRGTITALIPTFNEAHNIEECLACLTWVDQIVVCDSFSSDATVEIAKQFTTDVFQHEYIDSATQKNWAMDTLPIRGDWTLIVDADERIMPELADEIVELLAEDDQECIGYFVNRRNLFFGKWIRHAGFYPSWNLRLFRTGAARYECKKVDADVQTTRPGKVAHLRHDMLHHTSPTIASTVQRWNRYSTWDALERTKPAEERDDCAVVACASGRAATPLRRLYECLPGKALLMFLYMYVFRGGFMDGKAGFYVCSLYAFREFLAGAKLWELRQYPSVYRHDAR
jgi:glycosyltransferase involved in cell wall biosynthesis